VRTWEQVKSSTVSSHVTVYDLTLKLMRFIFQFINSVVVQIHVLILLTAFEIGVIPTRIRGVCHIKSLQTSFTKYVTFCNLSILLISTILEPD
jgi:hypothetical protein